MFKLYCKVAFRNLLKRKVSTLINLTGLAVGLACCILVFLFYSSEWIYDKGFDNGRDIYRVTSLFKDGSRAPTVPMPFGQLLHQEIPEIETVSRLDASRSPCVVKAMDDMAAEPYLEGSGYWVDPNFFDIFSYRFIEGDRKTALAAPNTIVISQSVADQLFPGRYPIGRRLRAGDGTYTVSGVFAQDKPDHIQAGFFASNNSQGVREAMAKITDWVADPNYYTYVRLRPGSNVAHVTDELHAYTTRHASADMKKRGERMTNALQPLWDIHLHSSQYYDYLSGKQGNLQYIYLLASIAGAILLLGCINYVNLSTAHALDRAREVGVRRVLGAAKPAIRRQFLVETLLISVFAMLLGLGLSALFLPAFNTFTGQHLSLFTPAGLAIVAWLLPAALLTGLMAGIYPAIYLSSFRPIRVLKGKLSVPGALLPVRKVLVVGQFVIATGLIIGTIVIWRQLQYMMTAKTGVNEARQLVIYLNSERLAGNSSYFIQQLKASPEVQSVAGGVDALLSGDMNLYPAEKSVNEKQDLYLDLVDENYLSTLGLELVAGKNFTPESFANTDRRQDMEDVDIGRQVILNERAVRALGYSLDHVVGKQLARYHNGHVNHYTIVGVVKDYHYLSMHAAIRPMALMPVNPLRFGRLVVRVREHGMEAAYAYARKTAGAIDGDSPFAADLLTNIFRYDYTADRREQQMMSAFTVIAILISCLGVLGLITYTVGQKAKEIGIRKVLGASVPDIVKLFAGQYLFLIGMANAVAGPIAWWIMQQWLTAFPYRVGISWWIFAVAFGVGCLVTLITLSVKTVKAALANPVDALRSE